VKLNKIEMALPHEINTRGVCALTPTAIRQEDQVYSGESNRARELTCLELLPGREDRRADRHRPAASGNRQDPCREQKLLARAEAHSDKRETLDANRTARRLASKRDAREDMRACHNGANLEPKCFGASMFYPRRGSGSHRNSSIREKSRNMTARKI
jgi:hypothetical protein